MDPLELLPPEMWAEIFVRVKEVTTITDWHNLYNSSPSFHNVAKSQRATILFPQVLPHLTKYLIKDDDDLKTLLPLRHVCHKWSQGVDSLIETKLMGGKGWPSVLKYFFSGGLEINAFLERFESHPTNPFIGSTIDIRGIGAPSTLSLIRKFGAHLKGLKMVVWGRDKRMLLGMGKVLKLCPALEYLQLGCGSDGFSSSVVQRLSAKAEFPLLPKLKSVDIRTMESYMEWSAMEKLQNRLLRICCNPDSLTEAAVDDVPSELIAMPNLTSVSLSGTTVEGLSRLRNNASWPLTQLTMNRFCSGKDLDLNMQAVFRAVERFGETLTTLTLNIRLQTPPGTPTAEEPPPPLFALPKLKCLRMTAPWNSISCIDFLANLSKLEEFYLDGWAAGGARKEGQQQIKVPFSSGTNIISMLESNIWELLPRLRKLYFSGGEREELQSLRAFPRFGHFYTRGMGSTPELVKTLRLYRINLENTGSVVGMCGREYGTGPVCLEWVGISSLGIHRAT